MTVVAGIDEAVRGVGLEPVFQPVVSVPDGVVVGFEALARWPSVTGVSPLEVFARARATGAADQLDRLCISSAITGALNGRLGRNALLCINCEPTTVGSRRAEDAVLARAHDELQVMFELTERHLLAHPRALLHKVEQLREDGFGIALDDVGVHPDSLALLDVIEPDVIKLPLAPFDLVRDHARVASGRKATLMEFSRQIEDRAFADADPPMLFKALQRAENFTGRTRLRYHDLAARSPLVAVFGEQLPSDVGGGVRGVRVGKDDRLHREWTVLSVGSHSAAGLIAREHTDNAVLGRRDEDRRFEFVLTFDRPLIIAAARTLLDRIP